MSNSRDEKTDPQLPSHRFNLRKEVERLWAEVEELKRKLEAIEEELRGE